MYTFVWEFEQEPDMSWADEETMQDWRDGRLECLCLLLKDAEGNVIDSLGNICVYPDDGSYCRSMMRQMAEDNGIDYADCESA